MGHKVALIRGDGIGPEIADATTKVIEAAGANIDWIEVFAGQNAADKFGTPLPEETLKTIEEVKVSLKAPLATPIGAGFRSINVALRKHFEMYANVRPVKTVPGIKTPFSDRDIDMVLIRENTEGAYIGIEHDIPPKGSAAESIILITRHACLRIARFAYEYAKTNNRKQVTIVHKANILKATSGLFLNICREVAADYPEIETIDLIVDNTAMQMVKRPEQFDVVVTTNLFGDILSDLGAGLIGGLGLTYASNIGDKVSMFEAVHGTAPDIAGKGIANPTALMLSSVEMLKHLGENAAADKLQKAIYGVLAQGEILTGDLGGNANTAQFTEAICKAIS